MAISKSVFWYQYVVNLGGTEIKYHVSKILNTR